ncbi:hypothetical protein IH785_07920 [candidate division KSB1 bacterium]|nr:hypothetical protein [candidate division KSB1 bacterium]
MKRVLIILLMVFVPHVNAQLPDPGNAVIIAKLKAIISQNQIRNMQLRKQLVEALRTTKTAINTFKELKQFHEYQKRVLRDIKSLDKLNLLNTNYLESFILNGDRLDFYLNSTSRKFMDDLYKTSRLSRSGNDLLEAFLKDESGSEFNKMDDQEMLAFIRQLDTESSIARMYNVKDMDKMFAIFLEQAKELRDLANDSSVDMTPAERAKLLVIANEMILKGHEYQVKAQQEMQEFNQDILGRVYQRRQNENLGSAILEYSKFETSAQKKLGFFDSDLIRRENIK